MVILLAKLTVPPGPAKTPGEPSVTVTVHVDAWLRSTGLVQLIVIVVCRIVNVIVIEPLAVPWIVSPKYLPAIVCGPVANELGVYFAEHFPFVRVQVANVPVPLRKFTVPVGVVPVVGFESDTMAVQVV